MTRFPTYPADILSRADAFLASKYPDGVVDPLLVEVACEAMMVQREADAGKADAERERHMINYRNGGQHLDAFYATAAENVAKAIRGTE